MLCEAIAEALIAGRQAVRILEAEPEDLAYGYTRDEESAQFAAVDRLVDVFKRLDAELAPKPRRYAECNECGEEVVFDAWVTAGGEIHSQYDENLCLGCEGRVGSNYTEREVQP